MADQGHARIRSAAAQLRRHRQRWTETLLLAGVTGVVTGLAVVAFDWVTADLLLTHVRTLPTPALAAMPGLGLLIAWLALRWLGRGASPSTSDEYIRNFHDRDRSLDLRPFPARMLASIATLGFGGAMGFEGPSIYLGAAIGTWLHRRFRRVFSVEDAKLLLAVGAAAGVAAIFKTPLTGALFAIEVPYQQDQARRVALPALIGAITSYVTFVLVRGAAPLIPVAGSPGFDVQDLVGALAVGILCGAGARGFAWLVRQAKDLHAKRPEWLTFVLAAVVLAALVPATVALYDDPLSIGPGYEVVHWVEQPSVGVGLLAALFLLRALATSGTIAGGGAGGTFIPLVVQGSVLGRLVAAVAGISQVTLLPLVGAAAFLGAGYRVPITAVVFVAESTGRPGFIVPGVLATVVAQLLMGNDSITPYQVRMRGGHVEQRLEMKVASATRAEWVPLRPEDALDGRIEGAFVRTKTLSLPVIATDGRYEGMVRLADVAAVRAGQREGSHVRDLLVDVPTTSPQATMLEAVTRMDEFELDCLPVGDGEQIRGIVTRDDALRLDEILARSRGMGEGSGGR
ncbi:MAG: chloride channel protein [Planctomycetaceae bacterium]